MTKKEYDKLNYLKNREKKLLQAKEYKKNNREEVLLKNKKYTLKNREILIIKKRLYYKKNLDILLKKERDIYHSKYPNAKYLNTKPMDEYLKNIETQNLELKLKLKLMEKELARIIKDYWLVETTDNTFYKKDFFKFKSIEAKPDNFFHIVFENLVDQPDYDIHIDSYQAHQYIESSSFQYIVNHSDGTAFETFHKDEIEITDKEDEN